jgi:predicted transcriptional regulator
MTQMRKFEQEAIATEILNKIKTNNSKEQNAMEKSSKELKNIRKLYAKTEGIQEQERELYRKRRNIVEEMDTAIKDFNNSLSSDSLFKLYKDYNDNITWSVNEWELKQNIENKLAIALISPDWKDKLSTIIDDIASQFGA